MQRHRYLIPVVMIALSSVTFSAHASGTHYAFNHKLCTIVGTSGNDNLQGTPGKDVICGLGGNDQVYDAGNGNDIIDGGAGNDDLHGRGGSDIIFGGSGNDTIDGGSGINTIYGQAGNDTIFGGGQPNTIYGDAGADTIFGGDGNDTLHGGDGNDTLHGTAGIDRLFGDAGNDTLFGGIGDDYLNGGTGKDRLYGIEGDSSSPNHERNICLPGDQWWVTGDTFSPNSDTLHNDCVDRTKPVIVSVQALDPTTVTDIANAPSITRFRIVFQDDYAGFYARDENPPRNTGGSFNGFRVRLQYRGQLTADTINGDCTSSDNIENSWNAGQPVTWNVLKTLNAVPTKVECTISMHWPQGSRADTYKFSRVLMNDRSGVGSDSPTFDYGNDSPKLTWPIITVR